MADEPDEDFALKLVGDGISIEKKVNKQIAMAIFNAVLSGGAAAEVVERVEADDRPRAKPALSPGEFLTASRATTNAEQITALGHYMCDHEAKDDFSNDDIRESFRRAREGIPKNIPRDVGTAIKSGWLHEAPGKSGRYYLTNAGMQLVQSNFGRTK
jgi:hypothetical protein